jgi:hypothetical protein
MSYLVPVLEIARILSRSKWDAGLVHKSVIGTEAVVVFERSAK